jgi:hypothetical protein
MIEAPEELRRAARETMEDAEISEPEALVPIRDEEVEVAVRALRVEMQAVREQRKRERLAETEPPIASAARA